MSRGGARGKRLRAEEMPALQTLRSPLLGLMAPRGSLRSSILRKRHKREVVWAGGGGVQYRTVVSHTCRSGNLLRYTACDMVRVLCSLRRGHYCDSVERPDCRRERSGCRAQGRFGGEACDEGCGDRSTKLPCQAGFARVDPSQYCTRYK